MNMQNAFSEPVEILAQHAALMDRVQRGATVETGEALACASALASALRAALMTSTAPTKPRAAKVAAPLAFDMHAPSFTRALRLAMRAAVTGGRCVIPILATVRLVASGDVLALSCNDMDREITVEVSAPDVGTWAAIVDAKTLLATVGKVKGLLTMRGEETEERTAGGKNGVPVTTWRDTVLTIGGAVSARLEGRCVADFPAAPPQRAPYQLLIQPGELASLLAYVQPAISQEETRYYLNGAFMHVSGDTLACVSTDGHRMHLATMPAWYGLAFAPVIIPRAAVADILAALAAPVDGFAFAISETGVTLKAGPVSIASKVIEGSFPDYTRVIPRGEAHTVVFEVSALDSALERAQAIKQTTGATRAVARLGFSPAGVEVSARTMEGATTSADVASVGPCACDYEMAFNASYLREAIKAAGSDQVTVRLDGPADAITVRPKNGDGSRIAVLMPLRA